MIKVCLVVYVSKTTSTMDKDAAISMPRPTPRLVWKMTSLTRLCLSEIFIAGMDHVPGCRSMRAKRWLDADRVRLDLDKSSRRISSHPLAGHERLRAKHEILARMSDSTGLVVQISVILYIVQDAGPRATAQQTTSASSLWTAIGSCDPVPD